MKWPGPPFLSNADDAEKIHMRAAQDKMWISWHISLYTSMAKTMICKTTQIVIMCLTFFLSNYDITLVIGCFIKTSDYKYSYFILLGTTSLIECSLKLTIVSLHD